jgi:hypothetical protein
MRTKIQFAVVALALSFALALPSNNSLNAQQALAEVSVESKTIAPNSTSSVNISLSNGPDAGVAAIRGSLRFDPKVLKATKVEGQQDYEVFASKLDNNAGEVGFVVVKLRAPYAKAGPLIKIEFQAIGKSGDKSDLRLFLSEFRDPDDRDIPNKIINGLITLGAVQNQPPTANFSFTPLNPKSTKRSRSRMSLLTPTAQRISSVGSGTSATARPAPTRTPRRNILRRKSTM